MPLIVLPPLPDNSLMMSESDFVYRIGNRQQVRIVPADPWLRETGERQVIQDSHSPAPRHSCDGSDILPVVDSLDRDLELERVRAGNLFDTNLGQLRLLQYAVIQRRIGSMSCNSSKSKNPQ